MEFWLVKMSRNWGRCPDLLSLPTAVSDSLIESANPDRCWQLVMVHLGSEMAFSPLHHLRAWSLGSEGLRGGAEHWVSWPEGSPIPGNVCIHWYIPTQELYREVETISSLRLGAHEKIGNAKSSFLRCLHKDGTTHYWFHCQLLWQGPRMPATASESDATEGS